jgi:DNA-binding protein Fis
MSNDRNTCFISIPTTEMLLDKLYGTGEKPTIQAIVHLDEALNALKAGLSLNDMVERAKCQVEHDILEQVLVATDYNISVAAELLNLDYCTMAEKIQDHFTAHSLSPSS